MHNRLVSHSHKIVSLHKCEVFNGCNIKASKIILKVHQDTFVDLGSKVAIKVGVTFTISASSLAIIFWS